MTTPTKQESLCKLQDDIKKFDEDFINIQNKDNSHLSSLYYTFIDQISNVDLNDYSVQTVSEYNSGQINTP